MRTLLVVLTLAAMALAEPTLLDTSKAIDQSVMPILLRYGQQPELTWGQKTALDDLDRLNKAAGKLVGALTDSSPNEIRPLVTELDVARRRVNASLQLLTLTEPEAQSVAAALVGAERLSAAVRHLADRFNGRDQPFGATLADTPLDPVDRPYYASPNDLLREATSIRFSAESLYGAACSPFGWRPGIGGPFVLQDLAELARASRDFESACQSNYANVMQTRPYFERLQRAYDRVSYAVYGPFAGFESHNIDRSLGRLRAFYSADR